MGSKYEWRVNGFRDFFVSLTENGYDFTDKDLLEDIKEELADIITSNLYDETDIKFLDYKIKVEDEIFIRVVPNNIVCAIWLCGIIPKGSDKIFREKKFEYDGKIYTFDRLKKIINIKSKNNGKN